MGGREALRSGEVRGRGAILFRDRAVARRSSDPEWRHGVRRRDRGGRRWGSPGIAGERSPDTGWSEDGRLGSNGTAVRQPGRPPPGHYVYTLDALARRPDAVGPGAWGCPLLFSDSLTGQPSSGTLPSLPQWKGDATWQSSPPLSVRCAPGGLRSR